MENRIIQVSKNLFTTVGIRSVSMDDIAKELGISKKTIYQYFKDKNGLVDAVVANSFNEEIISAENISKSADNPIEEIIISTEKMREIFTNTNPVLFYDLEKYHPVSWQKYLVLKEFFRNHFKKNLIDGINQNLYRKEIDPEILSKIRMEMIDMVFNMEVFNYKTDNIYNILLQSTELFLRGIFTPKGLETYLNTKNV